MLTRTLKTLERDGMVKRKMCATKLPQVEYALTALGRSLSAPGAAVGTVGARMSQPFTATVCGSTRIHERLPALSEFRALIERLRCDS